MPRALGLAGQVRRQAEALELAEREAVSEPRGVTLRAVAEEIAGVHRSEVLGAFMRGLAAEPPASAPYLKILADLLDKQPGGDRSGFGLNFSGSVEVKHRHELTLRQAERLLASADLSLEELRALETVAGLVARAGRPRALPDISAAPQHANPQPQTTQPTTTATPATERKRNARQISPVAAVAGSGPDDPELGF